MSRRLAWSSWMLALGVAAGVAGGNRLGVTVNLSPSMPRGVWVAAPSGPLQVGDVVRLCLPASPEQVLGRRRGYLPAGSCPNGSAPLIKMVAGLPGAAVTRQGEALVIQGRPWPGSRPRAQDRAGRPLIAASPGGRVPPGHVWVLSPFHPDSWDSRYWGPVAQTAIEHRLRRVWGWP